jgi:hypothetical protein
MYDLNLAPHEKRLITIMMCVMIGMVLFMSFRNKAEALADSESNLQTAQENFNAAQLFRETIISEREGQKVIRTKLKARSRSFDLYNFSNKCITDFKLQNRATLQSVGLSSRDKAFDGVQITLKGISLEELVNLLHTMYDSDNLIMMKKMNYLRPTRDKKGLECSLEMLSPKR